jgi:hypothetical protein
MARQRKLKDNPATGPFAVWAGDVLVQGDGPDGPFELCEVLAGGAYVGAPGGADLAAVRAELLTSCSIRVDPGWPAVDAGVLLCCCCGKVAASWRGANQNTPAMVGAARKEHRCR